MKENKDSILVDGAKQWYKHWSVWGILLLGLLPTLEQHGANIIAQLPQDWRASATLALSIIVAVLRFIKQKNIQK